MRGDTLGKAEILTPRLRLRRFSMQDMSGFAISHFVGNEPSRKVIERAGFIFEGVMPCGFKRFDGEIFDNVCYSILRSEYDTGLISSVRRMR